MNLLKNLAASIAFVAWGASTAQADHMYKRVVSDKYVGKICFGFKNPVDNTWHQALKTAVNKYNNAFSRNTKLGFCYNPHYDRSPTYATFVVNITVANFGNRMWNGKTDFPDRRGMPESDLLINTFNPRDQDSKVASIMHEMGHVIGMMHTNERRGKRILKGYDSRSLFRDATGTHLLPEFT